MYADATQVFGGRALTVTGMGKYIENVSSLSFSLSVAFGRCRFFGGYGNLAKLFYSSVNASMLIGFFFVLNWV